MDPTAKAPKTRETETLSKIRKLRTRLDEIRAYKLLLAVDGIKPDMDDKRIESELIVRLLYLEKQLKGPDPRSLAAKSKAVVEEAPYKPVQRVKRARR